MSLLETSLRVENVINDSGILLNQNSIERIKEKHYYVKPYELDGDAPKAFIKAYIFRENAGFRKKNLKSWPSYIAKTAEKWYPHESVVEYMINRIGQVMGLNMNEVELVYVNNQIRFLSKYFKSKNEVLVHGAEICGVYLNDDTFAKQIAIDRNTARDLFTFEFIIEAIKSVFPSSSEEIIDDLVRMIAFDAISGNNDRHFYNWGVIDSVKKARRKPIFAPIYDSARGFVWNWTDDEIRRQLTLRTNGGKKIDKYIRDASPRISCETNKKANHFELIDFLKGCDSNYKKIILELASQKNEIKVLNMLEKEFSKYFIKERNEIIRFIVKERFRKIRS